MARVAAVVLNSVTRDARVIREAQTLRDAGHQVMLFGISGQCADFAFLLDGVEVKLVCHADHTRSFAAASLLVSAALYVGIGLLILIAAVALLTSGGSIDLPDPTRMQLGHFLALGLGLAVCAGVAGLAFRLKGRKGRLLTDLRSVYRYARKGYWTPPASNGDASRIERPQSTQPYKPRWTDVAVNLLDRDSRDWIFRIHGIQRALLFSINPFAFDVIHCHDFTTLAVGIRLKQLNPKLKLVYDSHEYFSAVSHDNRARRRWVRYWEATYSSQVDACITVNDSIAELLVRSYPDLPRPVVVCNATPAPQTEPVNDGRLHLAAGLPADTKILLFQGGLASGRGLLALTESVASLKPGWALVYMAWGPFEKQIRQKMSDLDGMLPLTSARIRFVPPVSQSELAAWTAGATLGAILYEPVSANHVYCSPNKLWEYPRAGVPILCSDAPEMAKRVTEHGHGFLVPSGRLDGAMVAKVINELTDEQIAQARAACRRYIEADNWDIYAARLRAVYESLAPNP